MQVFIYHLQCSKYLFSCLETFYFNKFKIIYLILVHSCLDSIFCLDFNLKHLKFVLFRRFIQFLRIKSTRQIIPTVNLRDRSVFQHFKVSQIKDFSELTFFTLNDKSSSIYIIKVFAHTNKWTEWADIFLRNPWVPWG